LRLHNYPAILLTHYLFIFEDCTGLLTCSACQLLVFQPWIFFFFFFLAYMFHFGIEGLFIQGGEGQKEPQRGMTVSNLSGFTERRQWDSRIRIDLKAASIFLLRSLLTGPCEVWLDVDSPRDQKRDQSSPFKNTVFIHNAKNVQAWRKWHFIGRFLYVCHRKNIAHEMCARPDTEIREELEEAICLAGQWSLRASLNL
jgi:hypothetical protein